MVELMIASVLLSVITLAGALLIRLVSTAVMKTRVNVDSTMVAQRAFMVLEHEIYAANQFTKTTPTEVRFICDSSHAPGFALNVSSSPDVDGDALDPATWMTGGNLKPSWQYGYNLKDDDDNNDGLVDMEVKIYYDPVLHAIFKQENYACSTIPCDGGSNDVNWTPKKKIVDRVYFSSFTYFGNKASDEGMNLDTGPIDGVIDQNEMDVGDDGDPGTNDAGEGDGVLSKPAEVALVTSIRVHLEILSGTIKKSAYEKQADYVVDSEISPPLVAAKKGAD